ncbi:MAG: contractile injection system protein, VgrG/Pvc8 family [Pseudomonadota bacterium]
MTQLTPDFQISIGGEPFTDYLKALFALDQEAPPRAPANLDISITDNAGGTSDKLELTFARSGFTRPPKAGDKVDVAFGYVETGVVSMGIFTIDKPRSTLAKDGGRQISITATSADMTSKLKEPRNEGYEKRTVKDVVGKIAGRNGLSPVIDGELAAIELPQADQTQESDMHFLSRLARDVGASFKITDGRLIFMTRRSGKVASGAGKISHILAPTDILMASWEGGERAAFGKVQAAWHDKAKAKREIEEVSVGEGDTTKVLKRTYATKVQAKKAAEAEGKDGQAAKETMEVEIVGNPFIRAEHQVELPLLEPEYAGLWIAQKHLHRVGKGTGFRGTLSLERQG